MKLRSLIARAVLGASVGWFWGRAEHWIPHIPWLVVSLAGLVAIIAWTARGFREINQREREANEMLAHLRQGTKARQN
jgi:hypothetical protein